jgi:hypothetical protein
MQGTTSDQQAGPSFLKSYYPRSSTMEPLLTGPGYIPSSRMNAKRKHYRYFIPKKTTSKMNRGLLVSKKT